MDSFGKHIKVQVYGAKFDRLRNTVLTERFLLDVVAAVGMRPLDEPWVYDIKDWLEQNGLTPDQDEPEGVTGIVVLSTSHAAIHTWPHRRYAVIDIFSCSDFDADKAAEVIRSYYAPEKCTIHDVSESLRLPEVVA